MVNERLETAQTETNQRLKRMDDHPGSLEGNDYERKVRCRVMALSPARFQLNPHTHGPDPERPRNSTAIPTVQRCWRYCEGRSRPSVGPRHHGHPPLTLADANRPEPCQLAHRRRNCGLGKGTELNAV